MIHRTKTNKICNTARKTKKISNTGLTKKKKQKKKRVNPDSPEEQAIPAS
jgi:hypothetical protein